MLSVHFISKPCLSETRIITKHLYDDGGFPCSSALCVFVFLSCVYVCLVVFSICIYECMFVFHSVYMYLCLCFYSVSKFVYLCFYYVSVMSPCVFLDYVCRMYDCVQIDTLDRETQNHRTVVTPHHCISDDAVDEVIF